MQKLQKEIHTQTSKTDPADPCESMNIVKLAFDMAKAVEIFKTKAKKLFYSVMLLGHRCPKCNGSLVMATEGGCTCTSCGLNLDPTVEFERCLDCGGVPVLRVRRYRCRKCGIEIRSKFLFEGLVFNAAYFRQKVTESRQRKKELRKRVKEMLASSRSNQLSLDSVDASAIPGLWEALDSLTADLQETAQIVSHKEFDLGHYEKHLKTHITNTSMSLVEVPPLTEDKRRDLIWRFIAAIFLAHAGVIDIWQEGADVMVIKYEANRKRPDISGELEEANGIQGPMGGIEAW